MNRKTLFVLVSALLALAVFSLAFAGYDPAPAAPQTPVVEEPAPGDPVISGEPAPVDGIPSWQPAPGDENLIRGDLEIETSEIIILESFPPQFLLHLTGYKGNPCSLLRVKVNKPDAQNRIIVEAYKLTDPAAICIQVLESFEVHVPLGADLPAGEYSVVLNGATVGALQVP